MKRKGLVTLALSVGLVLAGTFSSFAGQAIVEGDKVKYIKDDGTYAVDEWIDFSDKTIMYFDKNGYVDKADYDYNMMVSNELGWTQDGKRWKYLINEETCLTNAWRKAGSLWFYIGEDGYQLLNQWHRDDDGKWYYLGEYGEMLTDTTTPDGYTVNEDGCWTVNGVVQVQQKVFCLVIDQY